jgi:hypothetical protein
MEERDSLQTTPRSRSPSVSRSAERCGEVSFAVARVYDPTAVTVDPERYKKAVLEMLSAPDERVSSKRVLDPDYWRDLNPQLSISGEATAASLEATPLSEQDVERIRDSVETHGYFETPATISLQAIDALLQAVETIRQEHLPPAFCFVYDEAWLLSWTPSLARLVSSVLGEGYRQVPHFWCHYVPAVPRAGGWTPHADGNDTLWKKRLTVWIPLTEATLENGCMYVIQKDLLPRSEGTPTTTDIFGAADARSLLRATRALPACPGQALGWDFRLIHWGSVCSDSVNFSRVSLSMEFIAGDEDPDADELPLVDVGVLPTFRDRLNFISRGTLSYTKFEPSLLRIKDVMEQVNRETSRANGL